MYVLCMQKIDTVFPTLGMSLSIQQATLRARFVSDHFPILLQNKIVDFEPKPLRVYDNS